MKTRKLLPQTLTLAVLTGCAATAPDNLNIAVHATTPELQQTSYRLGLVHLKLLREGQFDLDREAYEQGLRDGLENPVAAQTPNQSDWQALSALSLAEIKAANLAAGQAFLQTNKTREGVVTLPSGVQYQVLKQGTGNKPTPDDTVGLLYKISNISGEVKIDTTGKGARKLYEIPLAKIFSKGWQEAIQLMPQGSQWRLFIPADLAFGDKGLSEKGILPNETLVIETDLDSIVAPPVN
jgi:FKBP-type peptidyl-prolyl cis-trans isomerase FklB